MIGKAIRRHMNMKMALAGFRDAGKGKGEKLAISGIGWVVSDEK